jgi:hypothetical protein
MPDEPTQYSRSLGRMTSDHKPIVRRKRVDFWPVVLESRSAPLPITPFLDKFRVADNPPGICLYRSYCGLRFNGFPIASKKMALLPFAWGEKNSITSSSKKVKPVAPRCWAYTARYILPPMAPASSWTAL